MPRHRIPDCIYLDPADLEHPAGFNPLFGVAPDRRPLVAAHIVAAFRHIWADSWGPRLEYLLQNSLRLLLDGAGSTLLGLAALLVNERYRARLLPPAATRRSGSSGRRRLPPGAMSSRPRRCRRCRTRSARCSSPPMLRNILGQHGRPSTFPRS